MDDISILDENVGLIGHNLFAYCVNNTITMKDPSGNAWIAAIVGAVVNVATTFIAAKVTDQEYTWRDAGVAALAGAANVISPLLSGVISGVYSGYMAWKNGAEISEAIIVGAVSGIATTYSISNISNMLVPNGLNVPTAAFVDLVFGTGANCIAAATSKAITDNANKRSQTNNQDVAYDGKNPSDYALDKKRALMYKLYGI